MQKITFWLRSSALFGGIPLLTVVTLSFLVTGSILTVEGSEINWAFWLMTIISLMFMIYYLLIDKKTLSKVIFSEDEVKCQWLKKEIIKVSWSEIIEVKSTPNGWATPFLSFVTSRG